MSYRTEQYERTDPVPYGVRSRFAVRTVREYDVLMERQSNGGIYTAITLSGIVWVAVSAINYGEQARYAMGAGIPMPYLLPLAFDGMYVALAVVALVASLDGRAAVPARLGTVLAVTASSAVSGTAAVLRTAVQNPFDGTYHSRTDTVIIVAAMPWIALVAFEVSLVEVRRRVQKARGRKSPQPIPFPRAVRWLLSPFRTAYAWRTVVLSVTDAEMIVGGEAVRTELPVRTEPYAIESTVRTESTVRSATVRRTAVPDDAFLPAVRTATGLILERGETVTRDRLMITMRDECGTPVSAARAGRLLKMGAGRD